MEGSVWNSANSVTSSTGGVSEGNSRPARTGAPSPTPPSLSPTGSHNAAEHRLSLTSTTSLTCAGGSTISTATSSLDASPNPTLEVSEGRESDSTDNSTPLASSTQQESAGNSGPRSNALLSNQSYPPSSTPVAAAVNAAASLPKARTELSSCLPVGTGAGASVPVPASGSSKAVDARTLTTSFTTHDKTTAPPSNSQPSKASQRKPPPPFLAPIPTSRSSRIFLPSFGLRSSTSSSALRADTSISSSKDEPPTPPSKSPRTFSFSLLHSSSNTPSSSRSAGGPLASVFMGSGQSKSAGATSTARSHHAGQKLQKTNPQAQAQQQQHGASSPASTALSPSSNPTRGASSRSSSPEPTSPPSAHVMASQTPSQMAPVALVSSRMPSTSPLSAATPSIPTPGPSNSAGSKLKRAFGGARKKRSDDSKASAGMIGFPKAGESTTSLAEAEDGPANTRSLSPSGGTQGNRVSILPLSPGITSAVEFMREIGSTEEEGVRGITSASSEVRTVDQGGQDGGMRRKSDEGVGNGRGSLSPGGRLSGEGQSQVRERNIDVEEGERKENWRKSDSTIGHHTLRNTGVGVGSRSSRPVSMAESFQSAYTIVPTGSGGPGSIGGNKRWSTVTGDLDFQVMMEEAEEDDGGRTFIRGSSRGDNSRGSSKPSAKSINRRSLSLNVGISSSAKPLATTTYVNTTTTHPRATDSEPLSIAQSVSEGPFGSARSQHDEAVAASGYASSSTAPFVQGFHGAQVQGPQESSQSSSSLRSQPSIQSYHTPYASSTSFHSTSGVGPAWTPSSAPPPVVLDRHLPPPTMTNHRHGHSQSTSFRQTAISMSNGFAKRAAEKIGGISRKWGISSSSSGSTHSSSSSGKEHSTQPSSISSHYSKYEHGGVGIPLHRTPSGQSSLASSMKSGASLGSGITSNIVHHVQLPGRKKGDKKAFRRTPNAPSGAYSVASSVTSASTSESDGVSRPGPILGLLVRGPVNVNGGVVFGRHLSTVVSQTRALPVLSDERVSSFQIDGERGKLVKDLENRMLPALVVRCVQHILIWGIQEEGLFRVSGRASHVTKLRSEFDTGVDYDLTDCSPGDLDPHAVASIFKAYLRELPESILTSRLHRLFEAALSQELSSYPPAPMSPTKITTQATGLPSSPRPGFNNSVRKAPSLSTLAMPSFNGMPPASETLVTTLRALIAQLPIENCDLMRTVVELIRATAKASKETKMPLSNLLLVFCPSLNMTPPLLKALCDAEGIWDEVADDEVMEIKRSTIVISADRIHDDDDDAFADARDVLDSENQSLASEEHSPSEHYSSEYHASAENSMVLESSSETRDRAQVPTVYLDSHSHCSSGSLLSSPEDRPLKHHGIVFSPPLTSSSTDSLVTPVSSGPPSLNHLPRPDTKQDTFDTSFESRTSDRTALPSRAPASPMPRKHRSIPLLSFSGNTSTSEDTSPQPDSPGLRGKRPSLRRLFTKPSLASFTSVSSSRKRNSQLAADGGDSPYLDLPRSASSSSSVSTPLSAVTAPQSSAPHLPPVLDTAIDDSSLSVGLGLDLSPTGTLHDEPKTAKADRTSFSSPSPRTSVGQLGRSQQEPMINDPYRMKQGSSASLASSNHLGMLEDDGEEEDWMRSVLIAAGAQRG